MADGMMTSLMTSSDLERSRSWSVRDRLGYNGAPI